MLMGFGWVGVRCYCSWVGIGFVHPCIQLQIGVKLFRCMEYANQEALWAEANDIERPFICPIPPTLDVGGYYTLNYFLIHGRNLNSMGGDMSCYRWAWVDIGRC